ncbi:MAG: hypothetical protein IPI46_01080 [Bacteroidetes bacterium]|nr:hypothetical protein [Bacteroidota bacterium]
MKAKILNLLLIITSLFGYLAWGNNQHTFLFEAEAEIFSKLFSNPLSVIHPFIILPIIGQLLLGITLFQKISSTRLTYIGMACLGILLTLIFIIGILSSNMMIVASSIPFLMIAVFTIFYLRKLARNKRRK